MIFDVAFLAATAGVAFPKAGGLNLLHGMFAAGRAAEKFCGNQANGIDNYSGKDTVF
jgi:hypothetical protein